MEGHSLQIRTALLSLMMLSNNLTKKLTRARTLCSKNTLTFNARYSLRKRKYLKT